MSKCCYKNSVGNGCQFESLEELESHVFINKIFNTCKAISDQAKKPLFDHFNGVRGYYQKYPFYTSAEQQPYCIFHLPLKYKNNYSEIELINFIGWYTHIKEISSDFSGTAFVSLSNLNTPKLTYDVSTLTTLNFNNCIFDSGVKITSNPCTGRKSFQKSKFKGNITFSSEKFTNMYFNRCIFEGVVDFSNIGNRSDDDYIFNISFNKAIFEDHVNFTDRKFTGDTSFEEAKFLKSVDFTRSEFGQNTSFNKTDFHRNTTSATYESSFRQVRNQMDENKDRFLEGMFYALEQRCHRKKFT